MPVYTRKTRVPRPDVYVPRLPHLTHVRPRVKGLHQGRQWVRDNLTLVLAEHILRNWDECSRKSNSVLRQGVQGGQWSLRVNLANSIITIPSEVAGLEITDARLLSPGLVLYQPQKLSKEQEGKKESYQAELTEEGLAPPQGFPHQRGRDNLLLAVDMVNGTEGVHYSWNHINPYFNRKVQ